MEVVSKMDDNKLEFIVAAKSGKIIEEIPEKHLIGNINAPKVVEYKFKAGDYFSIYGNFGSG